MSAGAERDVLFRVQRFDPAAVSRPQTIEFVIRTRPGMTVLEGLWQIKESSEPGLSWRSSCRMGICGSCGMFIQGRPRLACNTQVAELGADQVDVAPLPNFPVIRDLVPDLGSMFGAHAEIRPYLIREDTTEQERPGGEYRQTRAELERYAQFSYCIKCGCCMSACPTLATDPVYAGPMPLAQAHRYNQDSRDGGFAIRREVLAGPRGPWRCHFAGECSRACPKGVDPARAIQRLKRDLVLDYLRLRRRSRPAPLATPPAGVARRPGIPDAPEPTV